MRVLSMKREQAKGSLDDESPTDKREEHLKSWCCRRLWERNWKQEKAGGNQSLTLTEIEMKSFLLLIKKRVESLFLKRENNVMSSFREGLEDVRDCV